MNKIYVLDTNVLVQAPHALMSFEENEVVLPLVVVEELDNLKKDEGEKGANVREAIRLLERFRERGNLLEGVETLRGGRIRIERNYLDVPLSPDLAEYKSDNRILKVCLGLTREHDRNVVPQRSPPL